MRTETSWRQKLERQQEARVVTIPPKMQKRFGRGKMLIPRPLAAEGHSIETAGKLRVKDPATSLVKL